MSDNSATATTPPDPRDHGPPPPGDLTILILAPTRNDARLTAKALAGAGLGVATFPDLPALCRRAAEGCGALLMAEEALEPAQLPILGALLEQQLSWSDIPIAVITSVGEMSSERRLRLTAWTARGNVTLIERPFRTSTLISTIEVALRSRRRQYLVRDLLRQNVERKEDLEFILTAGGLGSWQLDLRDELFTCSPLCKEHYGLAPEAPFSHLDMLALIHPEDRVKMTTLVAQTIRGESDYNAEYRIITPRGELRWLQVSGRLAADGGGLPRHLAGVTQNITARKRAEEALTQQTRALKEADQRKDEFLAMLAHELRNPLASVGNAAALIKSSDLPEDRTWAAGVIERQTSQLARLIEDLLDVSRINTGKIRLRRETLDVATVLDRAIESVRPLLKDRKHLLSCEYGRGELWIDADPTRIEQIILNLLTNAAKYTPAGGHITLRAVAKNGEITVAVRDTGIGIDPERLPQMFELFAQGERSIARSEGGLGIGLTIVRKLAEMHGGRVDAFSSGADQGSTFTLRLPAVGTPPGRPLPDAIPPSRIAGDTGLRILVVDDNVDSATVLCRLLQRKGHTTRVAHEGPAALQLAIAEKPEVLILDIGLPGMDGYEIAMRLRTDPAFAELLIIAVSGYGREDDLERSRAAGFDHHLVKPVDFREVETIIRTTRESRARLAHSSPATPIRAKAMNDPT
jgi:PAS domain S-box-containing protein